MSPKQIPVLFAVVAAAFLSFSAHKLDAGNVHNSTAIPDAGTAMTITARVDTAHSGPMIPGSFLGISVEYGRSIHLLFSGQQLTAMVHLLNRLGRLQGPPVLRIGGNSEDSSVWNLPSVHPRPDGDTINLTAQTAMMLRAAAAHTGGKLILGLNLERGTSAMAEAWIRSALKIIGVGHIQAFEIGNEPDLYKYHGTRSHSYTLQDYFRQWNAFADAIQPLMPRPHMLAGPAFCTSWRKYTPEFIAQEHHRLAVVTMHEYPLGASIKNHRYPGYPSIAHLLKNSSSAVYAKLIRSSVVAGRKYGIPVRFAEINSAYNGGKAGVSNAFSASLWSLDTLFEIASIGSAGVNFHTGPCYGAFWSFHKDSMRVLPLYYGLLMFAQAAPAGADMVPVIFKTQANVKIWMTLDRHHTARIVLINKGLHRNVMVQLRVPASAAGQLERLTASSLMEETHIYIGGLTFSGTHNGIPTGQTHTTSVPSQQGRYTVRMDHGSAALLTVQLRP